MTISKYNSEGYLDLTAHDALTAIEQEQRSLRAFRPIVYICSPYAGDIAANTEAARRYSRFAVEAGYIPIAPHLLFPQFLNDADPDERELGLFFGNALMSKCSEIWVFGSRISAGMQTEINRAKWKNYRLKSSIMVVMAGLLSLSGTSVGLPWGFVMRPPRMSLNCFFPRSVVMAVTPRTLRS